MDKNSAIGLTLIAVLLLVYFYFFSPSPTPPETKPIKQSTVVSKDSAQEKTSPVIDSATAKSYGNLASFLSGSESFTAVENDVLKLSFSNHATFSEVNLKNFKTYRQKPLNLVSNGNNIFSLVAGYQGQQINLYDLHYQPEVVKTGDSTQVVFAANLGDGSFLKHIYSIPAKGYKIGYRIESKGITFSGNDASFVWADNIPLQEKDINYDSRTKTTVNYFTSAGSFDGLSEGSTDARTVGEPLKWVSIRQKFFLSAIIANDRFTSGTLATTVNPADTVVVKRSDVDLAIPTKSLANNTAKFSYYFGPNDYRILGDVTEGFSRNIYLGWPPVIWVNKYLLVPVFNFLQNYIGNYGLIIVLLVIFMKMLLMPLTYNSFMGMAKMRLLKPELDLIKEKNGDNMAQAQQDQMKLYQQAGVNPFAGCIPLILQLPILLSMYFLFPNSIDLRQKPFLWADDLSTYDSILSLPFSIPSYGNHVSLFVLLMTISQLIFQWQNNQLQAVQGPMKAMSYVMPVIFMFVLNSFSAGLSFYYFISNLVTFAQQAVIKRFVDESKIKAIMDENRRKAASGVSKKSKFMSKLEDAMKASEEARKKAKK